MSKAWWLAVGVVGLAGGCGEKRKEEPATRPAPIVREEEMAVRPSDPPPTPQGDTTIDDLLLDNDPRVAAAGRVPDPIAQADPKPECIDEGALVSFDPAKLRACFDSNEDGEADRCVTWRRDGKVALIDTVFAVEDATAREPEAPPVTWHSDTENNDDERIMLDGHTIEICPFDRTCLKFQPKVGDSTEIQQVVSDGDYRRAVLAIKDDDGAKGVFEIWDLAAGRLRTRVALKRLVADESYDFSARLGSGVVIALADNGDSRALGSVFGLDGSARGDLAQGSRTLDLERTFSHAGTFGIVDVGADEDKPYIVYLHSLASGASIGKFTIKRDDDGDDDLSFHPLANGFVAVTQFGDEQVRIDMIDLRSRTDRVLFAPGC